MPDLSILVELADYEDWVKQKALKAGNLAFASMFLISIGTIIIQLLLAVNLRLVLGGITVVAFIVLRVLSYFNRNRCRISVNGEQRDISTTKTGNTRIYNAKDIVEAGKIIELLKEQGIAAFSQEAGTSVAMHGAPGFGMYGVDVLVEGDEAKKAIQIIEAADDSQSKENSLIYPSFPVDSRSGFYVIRGSQSLC